MQRVKQFYQDAYLGPSIDLHFEVIAITIELRFVAIIDESWTWNSKNLNINVSHNFIIRCIGPVEPQKWQQSSQ